MEDDAQKSASRKVGLTKNKTSQIYRRLEDVCTVDLEYNPITPFGGPGIVVKCDESKFNHKAKVSNIIFKNVILRKSPRQQVIFSVREGHSILRVFVCVVFDGSILGSSIITCF